MAEGTHLAQAIKANEEHIEVIAKEGAETRNTVNAMNLELQSMKARLMEFTVSFNRLAADIKKKLSAESNGERIEPNDFNQNRSCNGSGSEDSQEEFNKLHQLGTVSGYQKCFETLRVVIAVKNRHQPESYWISSFISGLKHEVKSMVSLLNPKILSETISLARLQEEALSKMTSNSVQIVKTNSQGELPIPTVSISKNGTTPTLKSWSSTRISAPKIVPINRLPIEEMQEMRSTGLCYNCDDKFVLGQLCKKQQLYMLEPESDMVEEDKKVLGEEVLVMTTEVSEVEVSAHALADQHSHNTLGITGLVRKSIIIGPCSNSKFPKFEWIMQGHKSSAEIELLSLRGSDAKSYAFSWSMQGSKFHDTGWNDNKVVTDDTCSAFSWNMQGYKYHTEIKLLSLRGHDAMLGVDWMKKYSSITMDFHKLMIKFEEDGNKVILKGSKGGTKSLIQQLYVDSLAKNSVAKVIREAIFDVVGHLFAISIDSEVGTNQKEDSMNSLLLSLGVCDSVLQTEQFQWYSKTQVAVEQLKWNMTTTLVLAMANFKEVIVVETDASHKRVIYALMQSNKYNVFLNWVLGSRAQSISTYENELLATVLALEKWRTYFCVVNIDFSQSLKLYLEQGLYTLLHQIWLGKLSDFAYEIQGARVPSTGSLPPFFTWAEEWKCTFTWVVTFSQPWVIPVQAWSDIAMGYYRYILKLDLFEALYGHKPCVEAASRCTIGVSAEAVGGQVWITCSISSYLAARGSDQK